MDNENLTGNLVYCNKCGNTNEQNTNYCINCGNELRSNNQNTVFDNDKNVNMYDNVHQNSAENSMNNGLQQSEQTIQSNQNDGYTKTSNKMNYFTYLFGAILKPFSKYKEFEPKLESFKNSVIISLIVIGIATFFNLLYAMISTVRVKSYWNGEVNWAWENLKNIDYIQTIVIYFLLYAVIIFGVATIYFLASLFIKKRTKFSKVLAVSATSFIPVSISNTILLPILSQINSIIGLIIAAIGYIYSLVILLELMNSSITIENKNAKIYFQTICLTSILLVFAFIMYSLVLGPLINNFGSML